MTFNRIVNLVGGIAQAVVAYVAVSVLGHAPEWFTTGVVLIILNIYLRAQDDLQ